MAYEARTFQSSTTNTPPTGTDPLVDNTTSGDVQAIKIIDGTAGSTTPIKSGGGVEADALRVTIASDSTGVLSVDDNGGSLTVDGAVAATQSGTWNVNNVSGTVSLPTGAATAANQSTANTALNALTGALSSVSTDAILVDGSAVTQPIESAVLNSIDTNIAQIEGDTGNIAVHTAIMDDWDESDRAKVNLIVGQAGITAGAGAVAANTPRTTLASDDPAVVALQIIDNMISGNEAQVDVITVPAPLSTTGGGTEATALRVTVANDSTGLLSVDDNGGSLTVDNGGTFAVQPGPSTSGGLSIFRSIDLDESEEEIKASAGQVYGWYFANLASSTRFIKFYNATAANVTVGTTTPVLTLPLPGNSSDDIAANALGGMGITFDTAITVAATTGVADSDVGAPGANEVIVNIFYK